MKCPKCGKENTNGAQICDSCSCNLTPGPTGELTQKTKISKMSIGAAGLAGLAVALSIFVNPTLAFSVALLGIFTAITSIARIRKSKGQLIGKSFAVVAVIFSTVHVVLLSYWRIDAAPLPNDYTISDIRSAQPEYNQSYELLNSLADEDEDSLGAPAIELSEKDVKNLEEISKVFNLKENNYSKITEVLKINTENINQAWKNAKKGRDIIEELNTLPEIADLTEPDIEYELPFLKNLRRLVYLYRAYVCLQSCQGNENIAVKELLKLDNVFRRLNWNARSLVAKLVCLACFAVNIQTASFITNNAQTSQDSLVLLSAHFMPLTNEQVSLRNALIFEYLMCKNELRKIYRESKMKYSFFSPLKLNSTFRLHKNFCDRWIAVEENRAKVEELTVWPTIYPKLPVKIDSDCNFPWYYEVYNPIGCLMVGIMIPAVDRVFEIKTKLQIHSDLLQILLKTILGKEISLKARAYSYEYIIDLRKKEIFSPGPDGEPYTEDDIKLLINPEVIGLVPE